MDSEKIKKKLWKILEILGPAGIIMSIFYGILNPPTTLEHANQRTLMYIWSTIVFLGMYKLESYMNKRLMDDRKKLLDMVESMLKNISENKLESVAKAVKEKSEVKKHMKDYKLLEEWAKKLNGREYREELTADEENELISLGIVAVFGASDDLMEFRGVIDDELDCYGGIKKYYIESEDSWTEKGTPDMPFVESIWSANGIPWQYETSCRKYMTFDIMEYGEVYCRGLLFYKDDFIGRQQ